jgi:hypothetical protein
VATAWSLKKPVNAWRGWALWYSPIARVLFREGLYPVGLRTSWRTWASTSCAGSTSRTHLQHLAASAWS